MHSKLTFLFCFLFYFILDVPMHVCLEQHLCVSFTITLAMLNEAFFHTIRTRKFFRNCVAKLKSVIIMQWNMLFKQNDTLIFAIICNMYDTLMFLVYNILINWKVNFTFQTIFYFNYIFLMLKLVCFLWSWILFIILFDRHF